MLPTGRPTGLAMGEKLTAEYWRNRAEEVRKLAETMKHKEARERLQQIASEYDNLAEWAERRERSRG
jgi:hypothetical protein